MVAPHRLLGSPVLRVLGPLPSTALLPLTFYFFPSSYSAAVFLIALATAFPVAVLTWSGVAGVNKSYYDVARTMGASGWFLVLRVAIPAALPQVFVGLFMGLGASFSVLVTAEMMGVKSGLGWYLTWAQGWASYVNMYAALIVMALLFSGLSHCCSPCATARSPGRKEPSNGSRTGTRPRGRWRPDRHSRCQPRLRRRRAAAAGAGRRQPRRRARRVRRAARPERLRQVHAAAAGGRARNPNAGADPQDGTPIDHPDPSRIVVFQDPTLYPWRRVRDNVALGLQARGLLRREGHRVDAALRRVGLEAFADAFPHQLSGGMAQRVALAARWSTIRGCSCSTNRSASSTR
jgi:energy-coupling factor transporter ATP-binding protein EcfA2